MEHLTTSEALATVAAQKLNNSLARTSLDELVAARTRRSLLLVDTSGSMADVIRTGERKIDALRKVVSNLRAERHVPVASFNSRVSLVDEEIPEPHGGTRMAEAIRFGKSQGANHLALVTDGETYDGAVISEAQAFGGPIDTFYIGEPNTYGASLAQQIAEITGGTATVTDLGNPRQLETTLRGLLGDGQTI